jgi:hypothetical protein
LLDGLAGSLSDADESGKGIGTALILRAVRELAGDDRRTENAFGSIVGRLDSFRF